MFKSGEFFCKFGALEAFVEEYRIGQVTVIQHIAKFNRSKIRRVEILNCLIGS